MHKPKAYKPQGGMDMSTHDIAKILGISQKQVTCTEQRGKNRFKQNWIYYEILRRHTDLAPNEIWLWLSAERHGVKDRHMRKRMRSIINNLVMIGNNNNE